MGCQGIVRAGVPVRQASQFALHTGAESLGKPPQHCRQAQPLVVSPYLRHGTRHAPIRRFSARRLKRVLTHINAPGGPFAQTGMLRFPRPSARGATDIFAIIPMSNKRFPIDPPHPERNCWGCDRYCASSALMCGNGSERTQHPVEFFGSDWATWLPPQEQAAPAAVRPDPTLAVPE